MNRAQRRAAKKSSGATLDQWRHSIMRDPRIGRENVMPLLAFSFLGDPTSMTAELPEDDAELTRQTNSAMPQVVAWLQRQGYDSAAALSW